MSNRRATSLIRRWAATLAALLVSCVCATAQYDDYGYNYDYGDEYTPPCQHSGSQRLWQIIRYRPGISINDKAVGTKGTIRFSDSCIEVDCYYLVMTFLISEKKKKSSDYICYYRHNDEDLYDYMEVRPAFGKDRSLYQVLVGKLDDDGNMQNTIQLICRPFRAATASRK